MTAPGEVGDPRIQVPIRIEPNGKTMPASVPMATGSSLGDPVAIIPTDEFALQYAAAPLRVPEVGETVVISRIRNEYGGIKFVGIPTAAVPPAPLPLPTFFGISGAGGAWPVIGIYNSTGARNLVFVVTRSVVEIAGMLQQNSFVSFDSSHIFNKTDFGVQPATARELLFFDWGGYAFFNWVGRREFLGASYDPESTPPYTTVEFAGYLEGYDFPNSVFIHPGGYGLCAFGDMWVWDVPWGEGVLRCEFQFLPSHPSIYGPEFFAIYRNPIPLDFGVATSEKGKKCRAVVVGSRLIYHYVDSVHSESWPSRALTSHDLTDTGGIWEMRACGSVIIGTNNSDVIYTSYNGFVSYTATHSLLSSNLHKIAANGSGDIWILDSVAPVAIRSTDSGRIWEKVDLPVVAGETYTAIEHCVDYLLFGTSGGQVIRYNYVAPPWTPIVAETWTNVSYTGGGYSGGAVATGRGDFGGSVDGIAYPILNCPTIQVSGTTYYFPGPNFAITAVGSFSDTVLARRLHGKIMITTEGDLSGMSVSVSVSINGAPIYSGSGSADLDILFPEPIQDPALTVNVAIGGGFIIRPHTVAVSLYDCHWDV